MSTESGPAHREDNGLTELDEAQIRTGFRRLERNSLFFEAHQAEWRKQYPDMYVAVYRGELVCVARTPETIIHCLRLKNIPSEESYCKFLASQRTALGIALAPANRMLPLN